MRVPSFLLLALTAGTSAYNIVLSNDDGWAEINIRTFYNTLTAAGENVLLSAPAENKSGSGSLNSPPSPLTSPCEYNSCPSGSPAVGNNASDPHLNYVNSYPATSMQYGVQNLSVPILGATPDFAVTGFNVGSNLGIQVPFSGTVGAACEAVSLGIPAVAFSGLTGSQTAWNVSPIPAYAAVYADLATNLTQTLLASGSPYLPSNTILNVNFGNIGSSTCTSPSDFQFLMSRVYPRIPFITAPDAEYCGSTAWSSENGIQGMSGCFASVSVVDAGTKRDASAAEQAVVVQKLGSILSCPPSS